MGTSRIVGCPLPKTHNTYLPIRRPGPGQGGRITGWMLSDEIVGVTTHWLDQRTEVCTKHLGHCDVCVVMRRKAAWRGYVAVIDNLTRNPAMFELTALAVAESAWLAGDAPGTLRGMMLSLQRRGESERGKVTARVSELAYGKPLPPCPDVIAALAALWNIGPEALRMIVKGGQA